MNTDVLLGLADLTLLAFIIILAWPWILKGSDSRLIEPTREFIKKNEGVFSIFFIILFALEQTLLILLTDYFKNNTGFLRLIISIFALVVMTTASLQKFILETKRRYEKEAKKSIKKTTLTLEKYKKLVGEYDKLMGRLEEQYKSKEE